jgi:hypothetical protein
VVPQGDGTMDANALELTIKTSLKEMHQRLERAASIAKAADACAEAGSIEKAVEVALDIEQLIYEVNTFLNAASMMHRIWKS